MLLLPKELRELEPACAVDPGYNGTGDYDHHDIGDYDYGDYGYFNHNSSVDGLGHRGGGGDGCGCGGGCGGSWI